MPSTRSEIMFFCISSVPPAIETAGTETRISAITPPSGLSAPVSIAPSSASLPPLDADGITGAYLRKGLDPIPNVRAVGELDDRLELVEAEVTIHFPGGPRRYLRRGPLWLGLVTGMQIELARLDEGG